MSKIEICHDPNNCVVSQKIYNCVARLFRLYDSPVLPYQIHHNGTHDDHGQLPAWARELFLHKMARLVCMSRQITDDEEHNIKLTTHESQIEIIRAKPPIPSDTTLNADMSRPSSDSSDLAFRMSDTTTPLHVRRFLLLFLCATPAKCTGVTVKRRRVRLKGGCQLICPELAEQ